MVAGEIEQLQLACLLAGPEDSDPAYLASAKRSGTMFVQVNLDDAGLRFDALTEIGVGPFRRRREQTLLEIQTSGTTGVPKRIAIDERTVEGALLDGGPPPAVSGAKPLLPKSSPALIFAPLAHLSGTFNTLMALLEVRTIVLFEKFDASKYRDAIVRYRPKFLPLPPTAIRMMLDSNATKEDLSSVIAVRAGTAPLPVDLQLAFERKFGIPVLVTYGATEFMGAATRWTLEDYQRYGEKKRGSVGRAANGVHIRIVDPLSSSECVPGSQGILQVRLDRIDEGRSWISTTDIGQIDEDGFLYILGRSDDAIIRGGFKVMASKVADVLRAYPGVYDVAVVGRKDERLGEVPVAALELYPNTPSPASEALRQFALLRLAAYEVPTEFHILDRLPRTISDKVSRPELNRVLDALRPPQPAH